MAYDSGVAYLDEPVAALRAAATRYFAWFESDAPAATTEVHATVDDVVTVYRVCARLPAVPPGSSRDVLAHPEIARQLTDRLNAAITSANATMPEVLPTATVELPGLTRLYGALRPILDTLPESLSELRAGWAGEWGGAALVDAGRLHDAFLLPVTPSSTGSFPAEAVESLRATAARFCAWCEADSPVVPATVRAMIDETLDLYQRCARIPDGLAAATDRVNVETPNPQFPDMGERLQARLGFYPGGLDDLYDYAWAITNAREITDDFLFSLYNGWSDGWGGLVLVDAGRLHDAFPPDS